jgi:recA bacterial DNA recombination protein
MKSAAQVRAYVEAALGPGFPSPFALRETRAPEHVSSGFVAVDVLTGGLPRASLTEISGPPSSGRTALELALLASLTTQGEACALIDAEDALDPASAQAAGVVLDRLLWVRCHGLEQALRAGDLLLQAGGFGAVVLDLADVPAWRTRRVPLSYWFRFRRAVENTPTILALIDEEPCAQSSASLVLRLENEGVRWSAATDEIRNLRLENFKSQISDLLDLESQVPNSPPARLLQEIRWRAEVVRNRNAKPKLLKLDDCRWPRESKLEIVAAHDGRTRRETMAGVETRKSKIETLENAVRKLQPGRMAQFELPISNFEF